MRHIPERGIFPSLQTFFRGQKAAQLFEQQEHLPWFVQILIYATSFATLYVFGAANIMEILRNGLAPVSVLSAALLLLLFLMIFSADRSFAVTIPRIPILAQRRQWGLLFEHLMFVISYGVILIATYAIVIYHAETNVQALLAGVSLIPAALFLPLLIMRSIMQVWTIAHGYLIAHKLEAQWSTFEHTGAALLGGSIITQIQSAHITQLPLGEQLRMFHLLINPPALLPGQWQFWRNSVRIQRREVERQRREQIVSVFEQITGNTAEVFEQNARNAAEVFEQSEISPETHPKQAAYAAPARKRSAAARIAPTTEEVDEALL